MVLGKNKGHKYEDKIFELLEKANLLYPGTTHIGMAGGEDATFCHRGKKYKLEIKDGLGADFGQKKFNWSKKDGWTWSENDKVTQFYTNDLTALSYVNRTKGAPIKYTKPNEELTYEDAEKDSKMFEDRNYKINPDALWKYYAIKDVHYIQIGSGYGFYHLDEDIAGLGTAPFVGNLILRFRRKFHDREKRTRDRSGKVIKKIKTPWNYSFMAVIKVLGKPKPKRSKYNLEKSDDQPPPPIKP